MSQLPKGWVETKLGSYLHLKNGFAFKSADYQEPSDSTVPVIRISDINGAYSSDEKANHVPKEKAAHGFEISEGDLLVAMSGATTGKIGVYKGETPAYQNQRVGNIRLNVPHIGNVKFRNHLVKYLSPTILKVAYGGAQPNISASGIESIDINLPPLAEQTRIVEKLDEVLAQVDTIKARLDGIPAILKRFRQSVLAAAVSGKLTEEWRKNNSGQQIKPLLYEIETQREKLKAAKLLKRSFGKHETVDPQSNELPDGWEWVCFDQISDNENNALKAGPFGSALKKSDCTDHGYRVYGQEQVIAGDETLVSYYINEEKYQQLEACSVKSGDILISLVGTIGKVLILSDKVESGIINPRLVKLSLNSEIQRKYIKAYLDSPLAWHFFNGFSHGGTMDILNLGILRKLPIPLPPVEEQKEIVRLVDQYFAFADTIEAQVKKAQARVDKLTQSILAKAFRGELVPQDPNDEPADKLLERIALARKEAEVLAKAAKKAAKK
ncbi:restriction endonuclease subunit S [Vibrio cholerae]|nr:restriction endonuclease subunit S [Vibrio cholerae]EIE9610339.1 restriction endonuclease subunit S [Vibrio cholerae]EJK2101669.1 restriction endonuclease subunit S [Vibrio cholerae]EJL6646270.1 restriction endonuclease subunit S [Vibrio cholerae]